MSVEALVMALNDAPSTCPQIPRGTYSGAVVSGNSLVIATIDVLRNGSPKLLWAKSHRIELEGTGQGALCAFSWELRALFRRQRTDTLLLRLAPPRSRFGGSETGAVIRTALQLIDHLMVTVVNTVSVTRWVSRDEPDLPQWSHRSSQLAAAQQRAVEAAGFAARFSGDSRYFSGGA